tara:strand:- start:305 stop:478 length:174 start_codon:yes stop_codon:yes gene_type:complete
MAESKKVKDLSKDELKKKLANLKDEKEKVKELYIKIAGAIEFVEGLISPPEKGDEKE